MSSLLWLSWNFRLFTKLPEAGCHVQPGWAPTGAGTPRVSSNATSTLIFCPSDLLLHFSSSLKTLNIRNVLSQCTLQVHTGSNERVKPLLHTTQDQGNMVCPLPALLGAEGSLDTHRGALICHPSKLRSAVASLDATTLPHFWVSSQVGSAPLQGSHPSLNCCTSEVTFPRLKLKHLHYHTATFPPVSWFSFWSIKSGNFSGRGNGIVCRWFLPARFHTSLLQTRWSLLYLVAADAVPTQYAAASLTAPSSHCRNPGASAAAPALALGLLLPRAAAAAQIPGSIL